MEKAGKDGKLTDFFRELGCDASAEEIEALFAAQDQELNAEELSGVAGGNLPSEKQAVMRALSDTQLSSGPGAPGTMHAGRVIRQVGTIPAGTMISVYIDAEENGYIYTNSNITNILSLPGMTGGSFRYCWVCKADLQYVGSPA